MLLCSGLAWATLGAVTALDWYRGTGTPSGAEASVSTTGHLPAHDAAASLHHHSATVDPGALDWTGMWLLMVMAMMWPLVVPTLEVVQRAGYPRWRVRLTITTLATSTVLWLGFGLAAASVASVASVPVGSPWWQLGFLAVAIAAWRSARRTRLLWTCVRLPPVAPGGRRGLVSAAHAGVVSWRRCGVLCGPVMVAMAVGHSPVVMVCASLSVWWEARHPRAWRDKVPLLLLGAAAAWVVVTGVVW